MTDGNATSHRAATCPKCGSSDATVLRHISGSDRGFIVPMTERRCADCRWKWFEVNEPVNIDARRPE